MSHSVTVGEAEGQHPPWGPLGWETQQLWADWAVPTGLPAPCSPQCAPMPPTSSAVASSHHKNGALKKQGLWS